MSCGLDCDRNFRGEGVEHAYDDSEQEVVFAVEIAVDQSDAHARLCCDGLHGYGVRSVPFHSFRGRVQQLQGALLCACSLRRFGRIDQFAGCHVSPESGGSDEFGFKRIVPS